MLRLFFLDGSDSGSCSASDLVVAMPSAWPNLVEAQDFGGGWVRPSFPCLEESAWTPGVGGQVCVGAPGFFMVGSSVLGFSLVCVTGPQSCDGIFHAAYAGIVMLARLDCPNDQSLSDRQYGFHQMMILGWTCVARDWLGNALCKTIMQVKVQLGHNVFLTCSRACVGSLLF